MESKRSPHVPPVQARCFIPFKRGVEKGPGDGKAQVLLERHTEAGSRKRKAATEFEEAAIRSWFAAVGRSCQDRKVRHEQAATVSAHATLCSVLHAHDIDPTQTLLAIYKQIGRCQTKALMLFQTQWEDYVRYLFASNAPEARQRAGIDPQWFDKKLAQVTFQTAFTCDLWRKTRQEHDKFDLLDVNAMGVKQRRPDQLLNTEEMLDKDAPKDACAVILQHVDNRRLRAKAKVLNVAFAKWMHEWEQKIRIPETVDMDAPKRILEPLAARAALDALVKNKRKEWAEAYELEGDQISAHGPEWEKDAEALYGEKKARCEAQTKKLQSLLYDHIRCRAFQHWCGCIIKEVQALRAAVEQCQEQGGALFQHVLLNWPTTQEQTVPAEKRFRLFAKVAPAIPANADMITQVQLVLDSFSGDSNELTELQNVVARLEQVLLEHHAKKASKEPLEERKEQFANAIYMDFANFAKVIAERVTNQAQVVVQENIEVADKAIAELEHAEQQLIATTLENKEPIRQGYLRVYSIIHGALKKQVWEKLQERAKTLREFDEKQHGTVVLYEPWLDRTMLSREQQAELKTLFPQIAQVPQTVSAALIQCSAWFEQLYSNACDAL